MNRPHLPRLLDPADVALLSKLLIYAVLFLAFAAILGFGWRVFTWAAGI